MDLNALFTLAEHLGRDPEAARAIQKAHREAINRKGHYRRTKAGALAWVESHQVHAHIAEHGPEPDVPKDTTTSVHMGTQAMEQAIKGHNVVHAMHRKGYGWVDFEQGVSDSEATRTGVKPFGIRHIWEKRDAEHRKDPSKPDGKATLRMLPEVIAKGRIISGNPEAAVLGLEHDGVRAFLAKTAQNRWLLTGYQR